MEKNLGILSKHVCEGKGWFSSCQIMDCRPCVADMESAYYCFMFKMCLVDVLLYHVLSVYGKLGIGRDVHFCLSS